MYAADLYTPRISPIAQASINIEESRHDMRIDRVKCGLERCGRGRVADVGGREGARERRGDVERADP
jgi:hypothetical protein